LSIWSELRFKLCWIDSSLFFPCSLPPLVWKRLKLSGH
jgi:hypothetical protein